MLFHLMISVQEEGTMEAGRSTKKKEILHEYLIEVLRDTSLQGLAHFTYRNRHTLEYLAWAMTIIATMGGAISVCLKTWHRFQNNPTVIAMEFNYLDWGVDSPSVYICPSSVVDENLLYEEALSPEIRARSNNPKPMSEITVFERGIFTLITNINSGFTSYLHSPNTIPNIVVPNGYSVRLGQTHIKTTAMEIYAAPAVRTLSVNQRRCRFDDELPLKHSSAYSINHCKQQCRIEYCLRLCGCLPLFYNISTEPTCNVTGMLCLSKHTDTLIYLKNFTTEEKLPCPCLPSCERFDYTIIDALDTELSGLAGVAILKAEVINPPHMRIRRDVLFSNIDLMVSFGGAVGLFLGSSVLSFVEIPYYCTLRLFFYLLRKRRQD